MAATSLFAARKKRRTAQGTVDYDSLTANYNKKLIIHGTGRALKLGPGQLQALQEAPFQ